MKLFIQLFIFGFTLNAFAQNDSVKAESKWKFGASIGVEYGKRIFKGTETKPFSVRNFNNTDERSAPSTRIGFDAYRSLTESSTLGISFHHVLSYYNTYKYDVLVHEKSRFTGNDTSYITDIILEYKMRYFVIPISYYKIFRAEKKTQPFISGSVSPWIFLEESYQGGGSEEMIDYKKISVMTVANAGLRFKHKSGTYFQFSGGISYLPFSIIKNPMEGRILSGNLMLSVYY